MVLRIDRNSLILKPTKDPNIFEVSANVTKDDSTVLKPVMQHVTVLWNSTTSKSALKDAMRAALKEDNLQADLRATIGEDIILAGSTPEPLTIVINAASVVVNQTGGN